MAEMRRFLRLLLPLLAAFALLPAAAAPNVTAESYILMDAETGAVLAEDNADERLPPASLTKIMAVYVIFLALQDGRLTLDEKVWISENAWGAKVVGSKMFIEVNTEVSVRDLLYGVIVQSGNDASIALAEALSGDEAAFAGEMTRIGKKMGLRNSNFKNATGLPHAEHYSSARDVAVAVRRTALDFPELYQIYAEPEFRYNDITQPNRNGLLARFAGADGVKTGYTKKAGYCLAASALRDGRRLIAVVMKTASPRARERESAKLLTYGFNQFKNVALYRAGERRRLPVWKGASGEVAVRPAEDGVFTVARDDDLRAEFAPLPALVAPLSAGDAVGTIRVLRGDDVLRETAVVAAEAVGEGGWWRRWRDAATLYFRSETHEPVLSEW